MTTDIVHPDAASPALRAWIEKVAALTMPDRVRWIDGSDAEHEWLIEELLAAGTVIRLDAKPDSFLARSDPGDVARVEDRTFICSPDPADAGPTNNWMDPAEMKAKMTDLFRGAMRGRTMFVIPFVMGRLHADHPMFGVQITDSPYVVASMRIMARIGIDVLEAIGDQFYVPCLHSVGAPLSPGQEDVPWPSNPIKYISHFPATREIWSFGSGYGGNALLGKKCYSLRIASAIGRDEGWMAEHMLILKLTDPDGAVHYVAGAFPSACGKTNLAMLEPTIDRWSVETIGDDIAWMRFGEDGRLYASNPEAGLFGVAPGTGWDTNPNAMRAIEAGGSVFTNVALTDEGDVWWEGMSDPPPHLVDWRSEDWSPDDGRLSSHPNSRFCTPIRNCPILAPEYDAPEGVPISAILFGGRRSSTIPLVVEARDWNHGVFLGATLSSETTAAATGAVGVVRRDPMAMLPFIGYHVGDYFQHWIDMGKEADASRLPRMFYVNWFRRDDDGGFLWPGFGDNSRVLKWIVERLRGEAAAVETPIGHIPTADSLDLEGLDIGAEQLERALGVDVDEWCAEVPLIEEWFEAIGEKTPTLLLAELDGLKTRLGF